MPADTLLRSNTPIAIAIIGAGPRGLAAAEAIAGRISRFQSPVTLTVFDATEPFGAGPNYAPGQPELNRLNLPMRAIDLGAPRQQGARLPDFTRWFARTQVKVEPELYPARAALGAYLKARFAHLCDAPPPGLSIITRSSAVHDLESTPHGWTVLAGEALHQFDHVLLTIGHQSVADPQINRWREHADITGAIFMPAYPSSTLLETAQDWRGRTIAIRGLGLSTIDVVRLLTEGLGGRFVPDGKGTLTYIPSGNEPRAILPFSLDGIPPAPKPANAAIDSLYDIDPTAAQAFEHRVARMMANPPDDPLSALCTILVECAAPVTDRLGLDAGTLSDWLAIERDPKAEHPIDERPARAILASHLAIAENREPPSVGYAIGQIWRKLQPPLRKGFNPPHVPRELAQDFVRFDEGLKRFSYGPPARAAHEMLALIDAGIVDLRAVEDPDIGLDATGWRLSGDPERVQEKWQRFSGSDTRQSKEGEAVATVMIDAVLPPADLERCDSPLIATLRDKGLLASKGEKLGARIASDGTVIDKNGKRFDGLALLGRMATGSVIATDSIHDCFGAAVDRWADGVVKSSAGVNS